MLVRGIFPFPSQVEKKMPLTANHGMDKSKNKTDKVQKLGRVGVINVNSLSTF